MGNLQSHSQSQEEERTLCEGTICYPKDVSLKIDAIEFALASFETHRAKKARVEFLRSNLDKVPALEAYLDLSKVELKTALKTKCLLLQSVLKKPQGTVISLFF